jgi:trigger factor
MQVTIEEVSTTRRKLAVEVPVEAVAAELDRAFDRMRREAKLKGFRPGRAPRSVLEKFFGGQVRADVLSHLIEHSYTDAVKQAGLRPVGPPEIVPESVETGQALRYSATVDVLPKIEIRESAGLQAKRPRRPVTDAEVDRAVEHLRESLAELRPVEGREEAHEGDFVSIDYVATVAGKALPNGKRENRLVEVGKGAVPAEIDRALVDMRVGDVRTIEVEFPAEHAEAAVAGKSVRFDVSLRGIREKVLPPAGDELAKEHGECATMEELRVKLRERIASSLAQDADEQVREQIVDELLRRNAFDVPKSLVDRQVEAFVEDLLARVGQQREILERDAQRLEKLREEYRPRAERQVRATLALDALAHQTETLVGDDEVESRIGELAARAGEQAKRLREFYRDDAARAELRASMARERALDRLVAEARVEEFDAAEGVVAPSEEKG